MSIISGKINELIAFLGLLIGVLFFLRQGDKGKKYFIRRIPAVDAMDEALERATEMGAAVHFAPGDRADIKGMFASQVIASLEMLRYIARHCAKLKTRLIVSLGGRGGTGGELVPLCQEVVRDAYDIEGGEYTEDIVRYIAGDKAGYICGMQGILRRENVASNLMIGPWAASIVAPTGVAASLGIVNISGTSRTYWIPVLSCFSDYLIMGEEMYAAGALLSEDTVTMATIKLSDYVKIVLYGMLAIGVITFSLLGLTGFLDIFDI